MLRIDKEIIVPGGDYIAFKIEEKTICRFGEEQRH